jgi:5-deoxy-glucuronate isomerase
VTAETELELAVCSAPGGGDHKVKLIAPGTHPQFVRGKGSNVRHVTNIMPEDDNSAHSLLVVEVITPNGNTSSYPSHKHDQDDLPNESLLEETYYHRMNPPQGFAFQRVYTDDRSLDEAMAVENGDVTLVPKGYHPCAAIHGYDLYYLNVMAGPKRVWKFHNQPEHEWLLKA